MQTSFTTRELANILMVTIQAVHNRAGKEGWPFEKKSNPKGGGIVKVYSSAGLPKEWQKKISAYMLKTALQNTNENKDIVPANANLTNTNKQGQTQAKRVVAPERAEAVGLAKYSLVRAWRDVLDTQPHGKKGQATEAFLLAYNTGKLLSGTYGRLGEMGESTLRELDKRLRESRPENNGNEDYRVLCDGRGGWRKHGSTLWRKRALGDAAKDAFLTCWLRPEQPTVSLAIRAARMMIERKGIVEESDDRTWRRWLDDWSKRNQHVVVLAREGEKAYRDKIGPYITRDDSILDVGQVLIADGHDLNFEILHPYTGRPARLKLVAWFDWASRMPVGWQIMPTENTVVIQAALRCALANLGKLPQVVYLDNGRAFKSKVFCDTDPDLSELSGLYARLGIATQFSQPYNARAKVIERFFETMNEQFERLLASYTGASISDKPAWRSRNEKFHRAQHAKRTCGWIPDIREAAWLVELYIQWYGQQEHSGIHWKKPAEVLAAGRGPGLDLGELSEQFLWTRKVSPRRCRVTLFGIDYESDCLHGYGEEVLVRHDCADLSRVWFYSLGGAYLGEGLPVRAINPIAKQLGDHVGVQEVKAEVERQRRLVKQTKEGLVALGASAEQVDGLAALPWREKAVVISRGDAEDAEKTEKPQIDQVERARLELVVSRAEAEIQAREKKGVTVERPEFFRSEHDRYEWSWRAVHEHGAEIGHEDQAFMVYFETTEEFQENYAGRYQALAKIYLL